MKVEMQFFGYFFSASAKKVRELKIMSFFHRLKCLDKLNYSSPRFGYDPLKTCFMNESTKDNTPFFYLITAIRSFQIRVGV